MRGWGAQPFWRGLLRSALHPEVLSPASQHPNLPVRPKDSALHPQGLGPAPPAQRGPSPAPAAPPRLAAPLAPLTMCRCSSADSSSESFPRPVSTKNSPSRTRRAVNAAAMAGTGGDGGGRAGPAADRLSTAQPS